MFSKKKVDSHTAGPKLSKLLTSESCAMSARSAGLYHDMGSGVG